MSKTPILQVRRSQAKEAGHLSALTAFVNKLELQTNLFHLHNNENNESLHRDSLKLPGDLLLGTRNASTWASGWVWFLFALPKQTAAVAQCLLCFLLPNAVAEYFNEARSEALHERHLI